MVDSIVVCCFICSVFSLTCSLNAINDNVRDEQRSSLRIGSFNIQNLGNNKFSNNEVMNIVKNIILRYDIILVQEIVTRDQRLINNMVASVNELAPSGVTYKMALSKRLGRGSAKEQYAFIYRSEKVSVLAEEVYPDRRDDFMRPPFIVHFSSQTIDHLPSFLAIGIHTQPSNAAKETDSLVDVYNYASKKYKIKDAIIMGDMNADCTNIRKKDWKNIRLLTERSFVWLIGDHVDTTTNANTCSYDRIVVNGNKMKQAVVKNSAKAFDFQTHFKLTIEQTKDVSDHWPVEVRLSS